MMKFLFKGKNNLIFFRVHKIQERRLTVSSRLKSFRASVMVSLLVLMLGFSKLWMCTMGMGTFFGRWDSYEFWNILCQTHGMISKGISPFWLVGGAKNITQQNGILSRKITRFCPRVSEWSGDACGSSELPQSLGTLTAILVGRAKGAMPSMIPCEK